MAEPLEVLERHGLEAPATGGFMHRANVAIGPAVVAAMLAFAREVAPDHIADVGKLVATPDQMAGVDGEVTQSDREAAADLISSYWRTTDREGQEMQKLAQSYRDGHSRGVWVQAFARHRRAAVAAERERCAQVVEEFGDTKQYPAHSVTTAVRDLAIAAAIRQETQP